MKTTKPKAAKPKFKPEPLYQIVFTHIRTKEKRLVARILGARNKDAYLATCNSLVGSSNFRASAIPLKVEPVRIVNNRVVKGAAK